MFSNLLVALPSETVIRMGWICSVGTYGDSCLPLFWSCRAVTGDDFVDSIYWHEKSFSTFFYIRHRLVARDLMKITAITAHFALGLPSCFLLIFSVSSLLVAAVHLSVVVPLLYCELCGTSESRVLIRCCHDKQLTAEQFCTLLSAVALQWHLSWIWASSVACAASAATLPLTVPA